MLQKWIHPIKGIIPQGKPCKEVAYATSKSLRWLSVAELRGINPFVSSLARSCASTVAISLHSPIK